jgi:hypothetical protein
LRRFGKWQNFSKWMSAKTPKTKTTMSKKAQPYKEQHHHPRFFLKGFTDETNHIWLHRPGQPAEKSGTKNACVLPWFYSVRDSVTGNRDNHIEIDVNGRIERAFAKILYNKVFKLQQITADEKLELSRTLAYQAFRTPAARKAILARYGHLTQRGAVAKLFEECPRAKQHANLEDFEDIPQTDDFKQHFALMKMFHIATPYTTSYNNKEWVFLRTDGRDPFITSDTTFAVDDPRDPLAREVNQHAPHTRVMIPLSSLMALVIHNGTPIIGGHLRARRAEVEDINTKIAQQAQEFVISNSASTKLPANYARSTFTIRN